MNIFDTPLGSDVYKIINNQGNATSAVKVGLEIICPSTIITARRVHTMNTVRDYNSNAYDMITAVIEVTVAEYERTLYPARAALEATLIRTESSVRAVANGKTTRRNYKLFLLTNEDHELFDQTYSGNDAEAKESNIMLVTVQLIELGVYLIKDAQYNTILGPGTIEDYLYYFMSYAGKYPTWVHPPDNTDSVDNTLIPPGIELINLANWLQREGPGIYNHGINTYFQHDIMYIYPIALLTTHIDRMKVNIFRAGNDLAIGSENSYAIIHGTLNIISAGTCIIGDEPVFIDDRELLEHKIGNSITWHDPRYQSSVIDETGDLLRYTSRGTNVYSLTDTDIKISKYHRKHTANPYAMRSIINKTLGRILHIPWQGGDIREITPGMEVNYYYMQGEKYECIFGIIEGVIENLALANDRITSDLMGIEVILKIRVV